MIKITVPLPKQITVACSGGVDSSGGGGSGSSGRSGSNGSGGSRW
jgi:hypothetical protein